MTQSGSASKMQGRMVSVSTKCLQWLRSPASGYGAALASQRLDDIEIETKVNAYDDGAIMMSRTQITLENEVQRRARQRASELGVSLAEYVRRLVARDLARPETAIAVDRVFDLGSSGGADIAREKDSMIAEAFHSRRRKTQSR
jgi:hypothetical protein